MYIKCSFVLRSHIFCYPKCFKLNEHVNVVYCLYIKLRGPTEGLVLWTIKPDLCAKQYLSATLFLHFQETFCYVNVIESGKHTMCIDITGDCMIQYHATFPSQLMSCR